MAEPSRGQGADRQTLLVWFLVLACVLILALLQPRPGEQRTVGRQSGQGQSRRLAPVEMRRPGRQLCDRHHDALRQRAIPRQTQDLELPSLRTFVGSPMERRIDHHFAPGPHRIHAGPGFRDHAGAIGARDARPLQSRVLPGLDPDIAVVERRGAQRYDDLALAGSRISDRDNAHLIRTCELHRAHRRKLRPPTSAGKRPRHRGNALASNHWRRVARRVLVALHKPYGVLSQFTPEPGSRWRTLADFGLPKGLYPLGRLDADSEGLLLLSDEPGLNTRLLDPRHAHRREYWVQVEGIPSVEALAQLARGVKIGDYTTRPCTIRRLEPVPAILPRDPPIRVRKTIPDSWLEITITEGRNRQVRRMTAAIGFPTLRLIRARIGDWSIDGLPNGQWRLA